jgi:hypothetical protein
MPLTFIPLKEMALRWCGLRSIPINVTAIAPIVAEAQLLEHRQVKSSIGHAQVRPTIKTMVGWAINAGKLNLPSPIEM